MGNSNFFQRAIAGIDQANKADPNIEPGEDKNYPREYLYSLRMSARLERFDPQASESLRLAARAQHIQRWKIPRSDYPQGRQGYKKWRSELAKFHAETTGNIMAESGYDAKAIERVKTLLQKKQLKRDDEVQALEDVICLVFIEHYLADFATKHPEEKVVDIIRKTWKKMSPKGHSAALKIPLTQQLGALVEKALS